MIILHTFLVLDRLKGEAREFRQELVDEVFGDMDRAMRELGVSDVSVGKKVRKMAEVFYGRVAAYDRALANGGAELEEVVRRNIFTDVGDSPGLSALAAYMRTTRDDLARQPVERIIAGDASFKEPTP